MGDKTSPDYLDDLMFKFRILQGGITVMHQCLVCKTYADPTNHKCAYKEVLALDS